MTHPSVVSISNQMKKKFDKNKITHIRNVQLANYHTVWHPIVTAVHTSGINSIP